MTIQHNIPGIGANRYLNIHQKRMAQSLERLSSGYKINRAADDPAGMGIVQSLEAKIRGLNAQIQSNKMELDRLGIQDGTLGVAQDILHRMRELATLSASDTCTDEDRELYDIEYQELLKEYRSLTGGVSFSGSGMAAIAEALRQGQGKDSLGALGITGIEASGELNGELQIDLFRNESGEAYAQLSIGDATLVQELSDGDRMTFRLDNGQEITIHIDRDSLEMGTVEGLRFLDGELDISVSSSITDLAKVFEMKGQGIMRTVGFSSSMGLSGSLKTRESAVESLEGLKDAQKNLSRARGALGARMNILQDRINNLEEQVINATDSMSTIRDADMAQEMMIYTKEMILAQAAQAMVAQSMDYQRTYVEMLKAM